MKTLYAEGDSILHRASARSKLVGLLLAGILTFLVTSIPLLIGLLVASALLLLSTRLGLKDLLRRLVPLAVTISILCGLTMLLQTVETGIISLLRLTLLLLVSTAVTATTAISDVMDEITAAATPLERLGLLRAADIGLAIGLVIRFVPEVAERYEVLRDAHTARGIRPKTLSLLVPLIILTLRDADEIAAAIDARGVRR
ncbi:CbiQ family ECF transporter T component [Rhizobium oryzicola]|uniref:CbiQ family ECF transporter T component n=1 Tax=Rhizobium oryzicola TaxID=1232668 RepID=A0ABT8SSC6_9HYPH|nr:CbiQ family ECF transporter T component [Rhizobium oryzicola]MDO1581279.1 CbiQ family ECF transporter T component [Rhizobium oryzicola]